MVWSFFLCSLPTNWYMLNMLTSSIILISVIEQTCVVGAAVRLDDSVSRKVYEIAEFVIFEIMPYAVIGILILVIVILVVGFILRLFS